MRRSRQALSLSTVFLLTSCATSGPTADELIAQAHEGNSRAAAPRPQAVPQDPTLVPLINTARAIQSKGVQAVGRRLCDSVIAIPTDKTASSGENLLAALESNFISRGLKVVSSALTARAVSDPATATLPTLERALVLAQRSNVDCLFQLLGLNLIDTSHRYYVWPEGQWSLVEVSKREWDSTADRRRWELTGELWTIEGKVIDAVSGAVLAIITLSSSTVDRQHSLAVEQADRQLMPSASGFGWQINKPDDVEYLRSTIMARLVSDIVGQVPSEASGKVPTR